MFTQRNSDGIESSELQVRAAQCTYDSEYFGKVPLRGTLLPRIDANTGNCIGWIISLGLLEPNVTLRLNNNIDRRLSREVMWEVYAVSYDRILSRLSFYQEVVTRHCDAMSNPEIHTVLDIGAGTGIPTIRMLDLNKEVTAVEINQAMSNRLASKLKDRHRQSFKLILDTAEALPSLMDRTFDGVNVLLAMFSMSNPFAALDEAIRLLKVGGTIAITEPRACFDVEDLMSAAEQSLRSSGKMQGVEADWQRIQVVAPLIQETIKDVEAKADTTQSGRPWNAETIEQILRDSRFADVSFRPSHNGNCATITGRKTC